MKRLIIVGGIVIIIAGILLALSGCRNPGTSLPKNLTLTMWGVWDERADLNDIITAYKRRHPYITIQYRKLRAEEYEDELVRAWAKGEGPDIFQIHNTWIGKYLDEGWLAPAPASTTSVTVTTKKNIFNQTEQSAAQQTVPFFTPDQMRQTFVDVVVQDTVRTPTTGKPAIYGLPFSVDTLALYYNQDLLNRASIAFPPATWAEFIDDVTALVVRDDEGGIVQAGAAMGSTSANIENAQDILALLMLQNGAAMLSADGRNVLFARPDAQGLPVGELALTFYTDFVNPTKTVYTWNDTMPNALDLFVQGKIGFFFGYSYHLPRIMGAGGGGNIHVAPMPQIDAESRFQVAFANYWLNGVFTNSPHKNDAWNFLQFATSKDQAKQYVTSARRPPARRDLIGSPPEGDADLLVFTQQVVSSQSWYRGRNPEAAKQVFDDMITTVVAGQATPAAAVNQAAGQILLTL